MSIPSLNPNRWLRAWGCAGWSSCRTQTGDVYYVNHHEKNTTWVRPGAVNAEPSILPPRPPAREYESTHHHSCVCCRALFVILSHRFCFLFLRVFRSRYYRQQTLEVGGCTLNPVSRLHRTRSLPLQQLLALFFFLVENAASWIACRCAIYRIGFSGIDKARLFAHKLSPMPCNTRGRPNITLEKPRVRSMINRGAHAFCFFFPTPKNNGLRKKCLPVRFTRRVISCGLYEVLRIEKLREYER